MRNLSCFPCAKEHDEQANLVKWWRYQASRETASLFFAIPNGGERNPIVAARLKAEGVVAGVPDLFLAMPRGGYAGLWLEMKRAAGGRVSEAQKRMLELLRGQGYAAEVCRGWKEGQRVICDYLERANG